MGRFLHHEPCPDCGSRDNLARYDDGSAFCFGCKYTEPRNKIPEKEKINANDTLSFRSTTPREYPSHVVQWFSKYGLDIAECLGRGIVYEFRRNQVIFPFTSEEGELCCYQARNFDSRRASQAKYYNVGAKEEAFPLYKSSSNSAGRSAVLTEDALSAIKVARQFDAMPLLGVTISAKKLARLKAHGYEKIIVWLDRDKWREANNIADMCKWIGMSAKTVLTDLDPKEYSNDEIRSYVNDT